MSNEYKALADRIAALEARVTELGTFLNSAFAYLSSDPASSLTKSRVIMEKVLLALYRGAREAGQVRYWQYGQAENSPDLGAGSGTGPLLAIWASRKLA